MTSLPVPDIPAGDEVAPYWASAAVGTLSVARCRRCARYFWYPRSRCPWCAGEEVEFREVSGTGVVYSFTVNRRPPARYREAPPLVNAYVELDEGPRVLTQLVDIDVEALHVGMPVRALFAADAEGTGLLRFSADHQKEFDE